MKKIKVVESTADHLEKIAIILLAFICVMNFVGVSKIIMAISPLITVLYVLFFIWFIEIVKE